jgi:hypothetical protein
MHDFLSLASVAYLSDTESILNRLKLAMKRKVITILNAQKILYH